MLVHFKPDQSPLLIFEDTSMKMPMTSCKTPSCVQEVPLDLAEKAIQQADVLIDVREAEGYMAGRIPGAVHMSRGVLEFKLSGTLLWQLATPGSCCIARRAAAPLAASPLQSMSRRTILVHCWRI